MFLSLLLLIGYPGADGVDGDEPSTTVACDVIQQDIALRTNRPRGIRFECPDGFQGSEELQAYVDGLAAQIDFDLGRRRRFVDVGQLRVTRGPDGGWRAADQKPVIRAMVMAPMDAARYQTEAICAVAARINDRGLVDGDPDIACAYSHDDVPAFVTDQIVRAVGEAAENSRWLPNMAQDCVATRFDLRMQIYVSAGTRLPQMGTLPDESTLPDLCAE